MLFVQRGLLPGQDALIGLRMSAGLPMPGKPATTTNIYRMQPFAERKPQANVSGKFYYQECVYPSKQMWFVVRKFLRKVRLMSPLLTPCRAKMKSACLQLRAGLDMVVEPKHFTLQVCSTCQRSAEFWGIWKVLYASLQTVMQMLLSKHTNKHFSLA